MLSYSRPDREESKAQAHSTTQMYHTKPSIIRRGSHPAIIHYLKWGIIIITSSSSKVIQCIILRQSKSMPCPTRPGVPQQKYHTATMACLTQENSISLFLTLPPIFHSYSPKAPTNLASGMSGLNHRLRVGHTHNYYITHTLLATTMGPIRVWNGMQCLCQIVEIDYGSGGNHRRNVAG